MNPALLVRLRPLGPWRYGPGEGGVDRLDTLYRSDRLFSALTIAMRQLGTIEEWLDATALASQPALAVSSLFPFQADTLFAVPPATLWPPPPGLVTAPSQVFLAKIRWTTAHFVPLSLIDGLISGQRLLADQWLTDGESGCLLRRDRPSSSPFRLVLRRSGAVDRLQSAPAEPVAAACVEFEPGAGLWTVVRYRDVDAEARWSGRVQAAFRLLADTGFGGRRSRGWGQTQAPEFETGRWPALLLPKAGRLASKDATRDSQVREDSRFWLISLYSPSLADQVDWTRGEYSVIIRSGYLDGASSGDRKKKSVRMIAEGSVLEASAEPVGAAVNVAPDGFEHKVYRSGLSLAFELPVSGTYGADTETLELRPVEEPETEDAVVPPCDAAEVELPAEEPATGQATLELEAEGTEPSSEPAPEATPHLEEMPQEQFPSLQASHEPSQNPNQSQEPSPEASEELAPSQTEGTAPSSEAQEDIDFEI